MTIINMYNENGYDIRSLSLESFNKVKSYHIYNANRNIELIFDDLSAEEIITIQNEIEIAPSPFVLTNDYNYDITDKDFRLFNIQPTFEYNEDYTIKKATYTKDSLLCLEEEYEYKFVDESIESMVKTIKWYRINGNIGATKVLNRVYNDVIEKEEKTSSIREQKVNRIKIELAKDGQYKDKIYQIKDSLNDFIKYGKKESLELALEEKFNVKEKL